MSTDKKKVRVTVDLSAGDFARLEQLADRTHLGKADMIRDALRLYEFLVKRVTSGHKVSISKDGMSETLVLFDLLPSEEHSAPAEQS